jgi:hypothetical protein
MVLIFSRTVQFAPFRDYKFGNVVTFFSISNRNFRGADRRIFGLMKKLSKLSVVKATSKP